MTESVISLTATGLCPLVNYAPHKEVHVMGLENTITEQEMDAVAQQFVRDIVAMTAANSSRI